MDTLRIRWVGGEAAFEPGTIVRVGRDVDAHVQPKNTNVSRHHVEIAHTPTGWVLRDVGSAQGTWRDGRQVESVDVRGTIQVTLGREGRGEVLTLEAAPSAPNALRATEIPLTPNTGPTQIVGGAVAPGFAQPPAGPIPGSGDGTIVVGAAAANRPGGALRAEALAGATVVTGDVLNVECAGRSYSFHPGQEVTVGRDAECDIVSINPTVSRRHARIRHDGTAWVLHDDGSASGTYIDGARITARPLAGSVAAWLGDETSGERLVMVARGTNPNAGRSKKRRISAIPIAVGVAVLVVGVAAVAFVVTRGADKGPSTDRLERATVLLFAGDYSGSGTIIDAKQGLILTNAHVVAPSEPGMAVAEGLFPNELPPTPKEIDVYIAPAIGKAAEPRFVAEVVAVDGYVDLAVIKITKTTAGEFVEPGSGDLAGLVDVKVGDSDALSPGDAIRVFGYLQAAQSASVTVLDGVVAGPVQDDRLTSNRAMLNISAPIGHGNSGGLAVNSHGELIGIPTLLRDGTIGSMRPAAFARPLITAARSGKPYTSPYYRPITGETVSAIALVAPGTAAGTNFDCTSSDPLPLDASAYGVSFSFKGFTANEHQDMIIAISSGDAEIGRWTLNREYPVRWPASGCATVTVPVDVSKITDPTAKINVKVGLGPAYKPIG